MIGHYLLTLAPEQEDRVLTQSFGGPWEPCLCMRVGGGIWGANFDEFVRREVPGSAYEALIARFGRPHVNAAIRNRILTNRLWRTLHGVGVPSLEDAR